MTTTLRLKTDHYDHLVQEVTIQLAFHPNRDLIIRNSAKTGWTAIHIAVLILAVLVVMFMFPSSSRAVWSQCFDAAMFIYMIGMGLYLANYCRQARLIRDAIGATR